MEVVFPLKRAAYLRGVPCLEAGLARLPASASAPREWSPASPDGAPYAIRDATFEGLQGGSLLVRELARFRATVSIATADTLASWREGPHDDLVLTVALACWQAERQPHWDASAIGLGKSNVVSQAPPGVFLS